MGQIMMRLVVFVMLALLGATSQAANVKILFLYGPSTNIIYGGNITALVADINAEVGHMNEAFSNNNNPHRVISGGVQYLAEDYQSGDGGYLPGDIQIANLRDSAGADGVIYLSGILTTIGAQQVNGSTAINPGQPRAPEMAFTSLWVERLYNRMIGGGNQPAYTASHEFGHMMGAFHDTADPGDPPGTTVRGYKFTGTASNGKVYCFSDIMAKLPVPDCANPLGRQIAYSDQILPVSTPVFPSSLLFVGYLGDSTHSAAATIQSTMLAASSWHNTSLFSTYPVMQQIAAVVTTISAWLNMQP